MRFETQLHEEVYDKIKRTLLAIHEVEDRYFVMCTPGEPSFELHHLSGGRTEYLGYIFVNHHCWNEDNDDDAINDVSVLIEAFVSKETEPSVKMLRYLLDKNDTLSFGAIAMRDDGDIVQVVNFFWNYTRNAFERYPDLEDLLDRVSGSVRGNSRGTDGGCRIVGVPHSFSNHTEGRDWTFQTVT